MNRFTLDEALVQRLPLPLAQLCRRACNAVSPLEQHLAAFYLWEAALKLLGSTAVIEYAELGDHDPELTERLKNLARPSVGHWWEIVRRLVPVLAERGDAGFAGVRDLVLGRAREDLPRAAGLYGALLEALEGKGGARASVRLTELFDRLVHYRNSEIGHGAVGNRPAERYQRMGAALFAGLTQLFERLDVLAGRRLIYIGDVRRQASGDWLADRYELVGESARRVESLQFAEADAGRLPRPERVYLESGTALRALSPLVHFEPAADQVYFLNARRGAKQIEYLSYRSGEPLRLEGQGSEQRELLARVLGQPVAPAAAEEWATRSLAEEGPAPEPHPARRTVGEFELLSRLGQGGMGVVYRAWQPSLGRQVAVKCLLRAGDAKAEARFAREVRALGRVDHPNLVKVFSSGSDGDQWFYAMELIEGAELAQVCQQLAGRAPGEVDDDTWRQAVTSACAEVRSREKPMPGSRSGDHPEHPPEKSAPHSSPGSPVAGGRGYVYRVVEIIQQIASAAQALHAAGVVHRDIKPGNILLTADGRTPVLMDLGLAQLADEADGRLTRTRQFVGTLRYASPEQVLAAGALDARTDVYSLGATLWELLTLRPLFDANDQTPTPELMLRIQSTEPGSARRLNRNVPRDLEAIVRKCLEKDRNRRYATGAELADDLGRFLNGEPVRAQPPSFSYLARKFVRRHWVPLAVTAAVLLLTVAGTVAAFLQVRAERNDALAAQEREEDERQKAEQALLDLQQSRKEAEVVWSVIDQAYSSVSDDNIRHLPGLSAVHEELANLRLQGYQKLAALKPDDPAIPPRLARGHFILGAIAAIVGRLDRAATNLQKAADIYENLERKAPHEPAYRLGRVRALRELGYAYHLAGLRQKAVAPLERAIALAEEAMKKRPNDLDLLHELGWACNPLGNQLSETTEKARKVQLYTRAKEVAEQLVRSGSRLADSYTLRASSRYNLFWQSADSTNPEAEAKVVAAFAADDLAAERAAPGSPFLVYFQGYTKLDQGKIVLRTQSAAKAQPRYDEAVALLRRAVAATPEVGRNVSMLAYALKKQAANYHRQRKLVEARAAYEECLRLMTDLVQRRDDRPDFARLLIEDRNDHAGFVENAKMNADPVAQLQDTTRARDQAVAEGRQLSARFPDDPRLNAAFATALWNRVVLSNNAKQYQQVLELARELMEVYRKRVIPHEPPGNRADTILGNLENVKETLAGLKHEDEVLKLSELSAELAPHASRDGADGACSVFLTAGEVLERRKQLDEAIKLYRKVLEIGEPELARSPWHWYLRSRVYRAHRLLADLYRARKDSRQEVHHLRGKLRVWYEPNTAVRGQKFLAPGRPDDAAEADAIREEIRLRAGSMKRFTIPCDFNGIKYPFHVYITDLKWPKHPLADQAKWLEEVRGGTIPKEVMDSFSRLQVIAYENHVSLQDLCVYALGAAASEDGKQVKIAFLDTPPLTPEKADAEIARLKTETADLKTRLERAPTDAKLRLELARAYVALGLAYVSASQPAEAAATFEGGSGVIDLVVAAAPKDVPRLELLARSLRARAGAYRNLLQTDKALVSLMRYLEVADVLARLPRPKEKTKVAPTNWYAQWRDALVLVGDLFTERKEPLPAARWYQKAIDEASTQGAEQLARLALEHRYVLDVLPVQTRSQFDLALRDSGTNLGAIPDKFAKLLDAARSMRQARQQSERDKVNAVRAAELERLAALSGKLAQQARSQGLVKEAIGWRTEELSLRARQRNLLPNDAKARAAEGEAAYDLALLFAGQKQGRDAVRWMDKAVLSGHEAARFEWAAWHANGTFMTKQPARASNLLATAYNLRGIRLNRAGRTEEALRHYQAAAQLSPTSAVLFDNQGYAYRQLRRWDRVIGAYRQSLRVVPNDAGTTLDLLEALLVGNRPRELLELAATLDKKTWAPPGPHTNVGYRRVVLYHGLQAIAHRLTSDDTTEPAAEKALFALTATPIQRGTGWSWTEIDHWLTTGSIPAAKKPAVERIVNEMKGITQERFTPYYPLAVGARWVYDARVLDAEGNVDTAYYQGEITFRVVAREKVNGIECYKVEESKQKHGKDGVNSTEHVVIRADGIYRVATGGKPLAMPLKLLALPAEQGANWRNVTGKHSGVFIADVTVPAGAYKSARLVLTDVPKPIDKTAPERAWYAEGVGPVKLQRPIGALGNVFTLSLKKYYPPGK